MASQQVSVFVLMVIFVYGTTRATDDIRKYHGESTAVDQNSNKNLDTADQIAETGLDKARKLFSIVPLRPALAPPGVLAVADLADVAKRWCFLNGFGARSPKNYSKDSIVFLPFTLLPTPFPKSFFEKLFKITPLQNILLHKAAHDHEFLTDTLKSIVEADEFTKRLFNIYDTVYKEGITQDYSVGLFRSDYMIDDKNGYLSVKQIESNTTAAGGAQFSRQITSLHKFILERLQLFDESRNLPETNAVDLYGAGLARAWSLYNKPDAIILFVLGEECYPLCDHTGVEFAIYKENPRITVFGRTFAELADGRASLTENKEYFVDGKEVAVVYFREGFDPKQFRSEASWQVKLDIERSKALKCPSIQYQLVGTKKVQQELAKEEVLSRFLSEDEIKEIRPTFTGLYSLDLNPAGDKVAEMAMQEPANFVLKPSRDGGGHNHYGADITEVLSKIGHSKERGGYILMDLVTPPANYNYIVRPYAKGNVIAEEIVSELGIFSVIIGSKDHIEMNTANGHLLRSKNKKDNEGGILQGTGASDSPFLYE